MNILAILLVTLSVGSYNFTEARYRVWYGKSALQDPLLERPSSERRSSSLEPSDPQYEVKVMRKLPGSQILEPFDRSKGQVVALVPGQALKCGIGPIERITYLSAKDVLRWNKFSEWLDQFERRDPKIKVAVSQSEDLNIESSLWWKLLYDPIQERVPRNALSVHVSDLPGDMLLALDSELWITAMYFVVKTKALLTLLFALPLIYGGIHIVTWNFHFASQTEHLL